MNDQRESEDASRFGEEGEEEHHGYSPDVGHASEEVAQAGDKAFDSPSQSKGLGRVVSEEEREGAAPTDIEAESPMNVGTSPSRSAEEVAAQESEEGRETVGAEEGTGRPYGVSTSEDSTGVDPQEPVDEESPYLPRGD